MTGHQEAQVLVRPCISRWVHGFEILALIHLGLFKIQQCIIVVFLACVQQKIEFPLTGAFFIDDGKRKFRIMSVAGPMGRCIEDLQMALQIIAGQIIRIQISHLCRGERSVVPIFANYALLGYPKSQMFQSFLQSNLQSKLW